MLEQSRLDGYTILEETELFELNATGYILKHNKTGARVVAISNDDENKVFTIGFKTPPSDDTGVPHIMEHSTLCGSKKYPAKDPFVELAKGSLNTFLNAMTYSDKTVYPIASCNIKDFENLMDVYLDAVFHPNIYERPEIMKQEGWHYDIDSLDGELKYNGVVYNEMKGVYSSPEQILYRNIQSSLLPDTTYSCDSGGNPDNIVDLTREDFIKFHQTYYHPSNSYIYLYGDMDMEKELNYIDKEYLSDYDYLEIDSSIALEPPFEKCKRVEMAYSISDTEPEENHTYLSYNAVVSTSLDRELYLAFQILDYALIDTPGAPLKTAMIDAGIGMDFVSSYDNGIRQPIYSLVSKGANPSDEKRFVEIIEATLRDIVAQGLDKRALEASMNFFEFKYKEANFGNYPKGLMYGLKLFDSWLYDDMKPFIHIKTNELFAILRKKMEDGYFEELLKTYILDNPHKSVLVFKPERGLNQRLEERTKEKLAEYKASLSVEQLQALIDDKKALVEYQMTPSTREELRSLPLLSLSDISKEARRLNNQEYEIGGVPVIGHDIFTNGISYLSLCFKLNDLEEGLYPYAALLTELFKYVDTDNYSYRDLSNEINIHTGGISFDMSGFTNEKTNEFTPLFMVKFKTFYDKVDRGFALAEEILYHSHITDEKRLREIIAECKIGLKEELASAGHSTASLRAQTYFSHAARYKDMTDGVAYYEFLDDMDSHFDVNKTTLQEKLALTLAEILRKGSMIISYTGKQDVKETLTEPVIHFCQGLSTRTRHESGEKAPFQVLNEGFGIAGKVQYVATAGDFKKAGYEYSAALDVLRVIFSYDYLWLQIRVKGGAYGAMCNFSRTGVGSLVSYRDPNLMETYEVFKKAPEYVQQFEADERDMTKYIIGAIARLDAPLTPAAAGAFHFAAYLSGVTDEELQKDRDEVLAATPEVIRSLAPIVRAVSDSGIICVVGDERKLREHKQSFGVVRNVF